MNYIKPHLFVLNELNLYKNDKCTKYQFGQYKLEHDNLSNVDRKFRTGILVHKDIHYIRRKDLEQNGVSTVWLELKYPGKKPLLVQGIYPSVQTFGVKRGQGPTGNRKLDGRPSSKNGSLH